MKVPEPRKLSSGSWFIQLRLGGVSVPITAATKTECKRQAASIKADYLVGKRDNLRPSSDLTMRQAIDKYIQAKENDLSPSTIRGYRIIQRTRFQKYMDTPLKKIKDFQAVYDSDVSDVSPKTLYNSFSLIKSVYAFMFGTALTGVVGVSVQKKQRPFLDYKQIETFLNAVKGKPCELGALLALHSLRASELLALTWENNIDLKEGFIIVSGAIVTDETEKLVRKDSNKTEASKRTVPIFIPRLTELLTQKQQQQGSVVHYKTAGGLRRNIDAVCAAAGLPQVGIHGLRHSFASLAFHLGIPEETTMRIGGWSDFQTMRTIYTHLAERDVANQIDSIKQFFQNANQNANN